MLSENHLLKGAFWYCQVNSLREWVLSGSITPSKELMVVKEHWIGAGTGGGPGSGHAKSTQRGLTGPWELGMWTWKPQDYGDWSPESRQEHPGEHSVGRSVSSRMLPAKGRASRRRDAQKGNLEGAAKAKWGEVESQRAGEGQGQRMPLEEGSGRQRPGKWCWFHTDNPPHLIPSQHTPYQIPQTMQNLTDVYLCSRKIQVYK